MDRLVLAEYQGRHDAEGKAVGHAPKVLGEYAALTAGDFDIRILAPRCILKATSEAGRQNAKVLPHSILMKSDNSFFQKIWNKIRMFSNIKIALKSDSDTVWFFNTEFYLMLYLALFGNGNKKIVCTLFMEKFGTGFLGKIKQKIFEIAQTNMSMIISAGKSFTFKNVPYVFIPDYYCDETEYAPYRRGARLHQAVCLGTMGSEKQIEELVDRFTQIGYPLIIAGRFYDKERLEKLKAAAGENITIRDEYLSREEYLKLMGESAYVVLPYAPTQYNTQTSGVLQEALFCDTVPVSYSDVLNGNGIDGIGFEKWEDLKSDGNSLYTASDDILDIQELRKDYSRLREEVYSRDAMKAKLCEALSLKPSC